MTFAPRGSALRGAEAGGDPKPDTHSEPSPHERPRSRITGGGRLGPAPKPGRATASAFDEEAAGTCREALTTPNNDKSADFHGWRFHG